MDNFDLPKFCTENFNIPIGLLDDAVNFYGELPKHIIEIDIKIDRKEKLNRILND